MAVQSISAASEGYIFQHCAVSVAQAVGGILNDYGYDHERDSGQTAEGGSLFSSGRMQKVNAAKKKRSSKARSSAASQNSISEQAASAELVSGKVDMEELVRKRPSYVGSVIRLNFERAYFYSSSSNPYLRIYGDDYTYGEYLYIPADEDALEWAVDFGESGNGGSVYVYVHKDRLYPVGTRKKKKGQAMRYNW